ncbi:hypothetical protein SDC9_102505 [bioreactor metagenome]|uniref:Nudix hydrolase domain-containing protein n=1 Tax=bioreactor metagenome TaxID=1076179 RepID=A0A645ASI2_9ZZZZ|nr:NUDIX hydrolase [Sphaerochaeta sp.]
MKRIRSYHGAGIIFWNKDEKQQVSILIGKRSMSPQNHRWSFPGGGWEMKDGFDEKGKIAYTKAAIRESGEEMGMAVEHAEKLVPLWALHVPYFHYKVYAYELDQKTTPPFIAEFSEANWVAVQDLPSPLVLFVASQVRCLRRYLKHKSV